MISADSVTLNFGDRSVLSGCYIDCRPGEIVGLLGRNGSGKSSLLKILFGSLDAQFAHLRVDGQVIRRPYLTGKVAYLPQHAFLPPHLRVRDLPEIGRITGEFLEPFALGQRVGSLSTGQQKLLECLWVLSRPAPYLLLDEPFMGIAPVLVEQISALIREKKKEKGIILTDHNYRDILAVSDRVVLLHQNSIYRVNEEADLERYGYVPGDYRTFSP